MFTALTLEDARYLITNELPACDVTAEIVGDWIYVTGGDPAFGEETVRVSNIDGALDMIRDVFAETGLTVYDPALRSSLRYRKRSA
jgi:hypothetical protein